MQRQTMFGVASVTKMVTAIGILLLQQRGAISLDDPVSLYYPDLKLAAQGDIRIVHLLSHSAGWPGMSSRFQAHNNGQPGDRSGGTHPVEAKGSAPIEMLKDADGLVAFINRQQLQPIAPAGTLLNYSNEGFCLLGGIIEKVSALHWHEFTRQFIFEPLQLKHTAIGTPSTNLQQLAQPLVKSDNGWKAAGIWDAPLFYPAGGMLTSVDDLLVLLSILEPDGPLLDDSARAVLCSHRLSVASRPDNRSGYGIGLEHRQFDVHHVMHWHTGQRAGISSFAAAIPALGLSMALLCNGTDAPLTSLAHKLLSQCSSLTDCDWPASAGKYCTPIADVCGTFANDEGIRYTVERISGSRNAIEYCLTTATGAQPMHFSTPDSGYAGQQSFCFMRDKKKNKNSKPAPHALAIDLRVLPRRSQT